jgi:NitT/TauT family transport system ATP-binding protein
VVEVRSATKVFPNGTRVREAIDLVERAGDFVTLLGPSGCGKSTLCKMVANLRQPRARRILWWRHGCDCVGEAGKRLAFVFQDPTPMPWARVRANVSPPVDLARADRRAADRAGARAPAGGSTRGNAGDLGELGQPTGSAESQPLPGARL